MSKRSHRRDRTVTTLADFRPQRVNANTHTPRGLGMLDAAMAQDGYVAPMTAAADGEIIDGSARLVRAAERFAGVAPIIVPHDGTRPIIAVRTDIPSANTPEAKRIALAANRIAQADLLWSSEVLAQIVADMPDVTTGLWSDAELHALLADAGRGSADADPQWDRAAELQAEWDTAVGQLWALGEHRLLCGDATTAEAYERLFGADRYTLLVTDPPYGVAYADKNAFLNATGRGNRIQTPIANDHHPPDEMAQFWTRALTMARTCAVPGASYYMTGPQGGELLLLLLHALRNSGFPLRHMLIWAKNNHVLGRCDYHYQHEPILYGWVEGAGHRFYGGHSETSVWAIDKPLASDLHPTTKPVELYARAMRNSSQPGEIVVDIFAGSGTAILAAEQLGRRCRAMELEAPYVAVILQRYLDATGTRPVLVEAA